MAEAYSDKELAMLAEGVYYVSPEEGFGRFLATITADRKRFEETIDGYTKDWAEQKRKFQKQITDQTATIERLKTAIHDCIERPKGVVPDSAVEFYDMRGPAIIEKPNDQALNAEKE